MIDYVLNLILEEKFELGDITHWVRLIIEMFLEIVPCLHIKIKFNCVVAGSDTFNIPLDESVESYALDIVKVNDHKQVHKNSE